MLNYSEFGTTVDSVLYSCDCKKPIKRRKKDEGALREAVKTIVGKRKQQQPLEKFTEPVEISCKCSLKNCNSDSVEEGWEGSALLSHGSIISFGCLMFLFTTADAR